MSTCYRRHEQEKETGIWSGKLNMDISHLVSFQYPVYKKLASMIATKHNQPYSQTANWLHCRVSFSLLHSSIMCISHPANPQIPEDAINSCLLCCAHNKKCFWYTSGWSSPVHAILVLTRAWPPAARSPCYLENLWCVAFIVLCSSRSCLHMSAYTNCWTQYGYHTCYKMLGKWEHQKGKQAGF